MLVHAGERRLHEAEAAAIAIGERIGARPHSRIPVQADHLAPCGLQERLAVAAIAKCGVHHRIAVLHRGGGQHGVEHDRYVRTHGHQKRGAPSRRVVFAFSRAARMRSS